MEPGKDINLIRAIYAACLLFSLLILTFSLHAQHDIPGMDYRSETRAKKPVAIEHVGEVNATSLNGESPQFISVPILFIKGGGNYTYAIEVSDEDGDVISVSATSLPDWLSLSVNHNNTSLVAGSGTGAQVDGYGSAASFSTPYGLTVADNGNIYVADAAGTSVRLVTPQGEVSSLALTDPSGAPFSLASIHDVVIDSQGNLYVPERFKHRILKIDTDLKVTVLAGGSQGFDNGNGAEARFKFPMGLAVDSNDNIYVADSGNSAIRKIDTNGEVTIFAGGKGYGTNDGDYSTARLADPFEIAIDKDDNIYVADRGTGRIRKITPDRQVTTLAGSGTQPDGITTYPSIKSPTGIDVDDAGNVYVADLGNDVIRKISVSGEISVIAGVLDQDGDATGDVATARFDGPAGIAVGPSGKLYVADHRNHNIKQIGGTYYLSGKAGTVDGDYDIVLTATDETGESTEQSFKLKVEGVHAPEIISNPVLSVDEKTSYHYPILTKDDNGDPVTVTAVTKPGWLSLGGSNSNLVSTLAGNGTQEHKDGTGGEAAFQSPYGLMADPDGTLYVADAGGNSIRVISLEGVVSTMQLKDEQGNDFALKAIHDVVRDSQGNFYVPERTNHQILKISATGVVSVLAGSSRGYANGVGGVARFNFPMGLAVDSDDNIYVADSNNNRIRKITPGGQVTTIGERTDFSDPFEVAYGPDGRLYVADRGGNRIVRLSLQGEATVIAGSGTQPDGTGIYPRFGRPTGIDVDASGNVYFAEIESHTIRRISPSGIVSILAGAINEKGNVQGEASVARFNGPAGITVDAAGNLYIAEVHSDVIRKISGGSYWLEGTANVLPGAYNVSLKAEDPGGAIDTQDFIIQVLDKTRPELTSARRVEFPENSSDVAYTVTADDASPLSFVLGSQNDEHLFQLNETTGELRFISPPDFEAPLSKVDSNVYSVFITISDSNDNSIGVTIAIEVTDISDNPPVFTSTPVESASQNENYEYVATTIEPDDQEVTLTATGLPDWLRLRYGDVNIVSLWAGNGIEEHKDGTGNEAAFQSPYGLMADPDGTLYVADAGGNSIRVVSPEGVVSTMKMKDEQGNDFALKAIHDVVRDSQGNFYVPERTKHRILKISSGGVVTVLAGSNRGFKDGAGEAAKFNYPMGLAVDSDDNVYVADSNNNRIRKISPAGQVTTIGKWTDFSDPFEVAYGPDGNLYVADRGGNRVIKLTLEGEATMIAGSGTQPDGTGTYPRLGRPTGIDVDASGNVYIAEIENHTIRKISPSGVVSILAGAIRQKGDIEGEASAARFNGPAGITVDAAGNLYIAEVHSDVIRKITEGAYILESTKGKPVGVYPIVLTATDSDGNSTDQQFNVTIANSTPEITAIELDKENGFLEVRFTEPVFSVPDASSAVTSDMFTLQLSGGIAQNLVVTGLTDENDQPLTGGEATLRLNFTFDGLAEGTELLNLIFMESDFYDAEGASLSTYADPRQFTLFDKTRPFVQSLVMAADNSYVDVTFNESIFNHRQQSGVLDRYSIILGGSGVGHLSPFITTHYTDFNDASLNVPATEVRVYFTMGGIPNGSEQLWVRFQTQGLKDAAGNFASISQTARADLKDQLGPQGYGLSSLITGVGLLNETNFSFDLSGAELPGAYSYTISSSGGGTPLTAQGSVTGINQSFGPVDVSNLPDGTLTVQMVLSDVLGNEGAPVSIDVIKDTTPPVMAFTERPGEDKIRVTFSENIAVDQLSASDFILTDCSGSTFTVQPITDDIPNDNQLTLNITGVSGIDGSMLLTYTHGTGTIKDDYDNTMVSDGTGVTVFGGFFNIENAAFQASQSFSLEDGNLPFIAGDIDFSNDGTKLYLSGQIEADRNVVSEYRLGNPYDLANATFSGLLEFSEMGFVGPKFDFSQDGKKLLVYKPESFDVVLYSLGEPFDLATQSNKSDLTLSGGPGRFGLKDMWFSDDGRLFTAVYSERSEISFNYNGDNEIVQYRLNTPYAFNSIVQSSRKSVDLDNNTPESFEFSDDGRHLLILSASQSVLSYRLTTPFDIATAIFVTDEEANFSPSFSDAEAVGLSLHRTGKSTFLITPEGRIDQYNFVDESAPVVTGVVQSSSTRITLQLSEAVTLNTNAGTNFTLTDGSGNDFQVNQVSISSGNTLVLDVADMSAATGDLFLLYSHTNNQVADAACIPMAGFAEPWRIDIDQEAPVMSSLTNLSDTELQLTFSEPVQLEGFAVSDFVLKNGLGNTVPTLSMQPALTEDNQLIIEVASLSGIVGDALLTYTALNGTIEDFGDNTMDADNTGVTANLDTTLPTLISATVVSNNQVKLVFSETVDVNRTHEDDFSIKDGAGNSIDVSPQHIGHTPGSELTLEVSNALSNAVGDITVTYTNAHGAVRDFGGNVMTTDLNGILIDHDKVAPALVGVQKENDQNLILTFNEPVQSTGSANTGFKVTDGMGNEGTGLIQGDETPFDNKVTLKVSNLSTLIGDLLITYTNTQNEIADFGSNVLATNTTGVVADLDVTAPTLVSGINDNNQRLILTLSEAVQVLDANPGDFVVVDSRGTTFTTIEIDDVDPADTQIALLVKDLNLAVGTLQISYAKTSGTISDFGGNDLATDANGVMIEDNTPPVMLSATKTSEDRITINMSEPVRAVYNTTGKFRVTDSQGREFLPGNPFVVYWNSSQLHLYIPGISRAACELKITYENAGTIGDFSGNLMAEDLTGISLPVHQAHDISKGQKVRDNEGYSFETILSIDAATSMEFSHTGHRLFILGTASNSEDQYIYQLNLSVPFDLSTATYEGVKLLVDSNTDHITSFLFDNSGDQLFVLNGPGGFIEVFDLSNAYSLTGAVNRGPDARGIFYEEGVTARGFDFSDDGTRLTVVKNFLNSNTSEPLSRLVYFYFEPTEAYNISLIKSIASAQKQTSSSGPATRVIKYDNEEKSIVWTWASDPEFFTTVTQRGFRNGPFTDSFEGFNRFRIAGDEIQDIGFNDDGSAFFVLSDRIYEYQIIDHDGPVMAEGNIRGEDQLEINFHENVVMNGAQPSDFIVRDCRGNSLTVSSINDPLVADRNLMLTIPELSSASGGVTVTYINNSGGVLDLNCNVMESDQVGIEVPLAFNSHDVHQAVLSKESSEFTAANLGSHRLVDVDFSHDGMQAFFNYGIVVYNYELYQPFDFDYPIVPKNALEFYYYELVPYEVDLSLFDEEGSSWYAYFEATGILQTYDLEKPYDLEITDMEKSGQLDLRSQGISPNDMSFNKDGTLLFVLEDGFSVYELAEPYNIENAVYLGKQNTFNTILNALDTDLRSFAFDVSGSQVFVAGAEHDRVYRFSLDDPYDLSTASYAGNTQDMQIPAEVGHPLSINFSNHGDKLFLTGESGGFFIFDLPTLVDGTAPVLESGRTENANKLILSFNEEVTVYESYPEDFIVTDGIGNVLTVDAVSDITAGDNEITLSVATLGTAVGDVRVTYVNNHNEVADFNCNALATDASGVLVDTDVTAPTLVSAAKDNNTQLTLTFSEPVQTNGGNPTDFQVTDLAGTSFSVITQADGTASDNQIVLNTADLSSALSQLSITYENQHDELADFGGNLLATDAVGVKVIVDFIAPDVTISSTLSGTVNTDIPITITFTEDVVSFDLSDITISNGIASGFSGSGAVYTVSISPSANGAVLVDIAAGVTQDAAGNDNTAATQFGIQADITGPDAPLVKAVSDDTGADPTDFVTSDQTLIFSGTAEVNSLVEIFIDGNSIGTTLTDGLGEWTYDHSALTLNDGSYDITTRATDVIGNVGNQGAVQSVVVDTNTPTNPLLAGITEDTGISNTDFITNDTRLIYSGTAEPFAAIIVGAGPFTLQTTTADANGNWIADVTFRPFTSSITIFITAADAAGNASPNTNTFLIGIDTNAPDVQSIVRADPNPASATSVEYTVTFSEAVYGVTTNNFSLVFTGTQDAAIASLSASSGTSITVTVDNIIGEGSFGLNLNNTSGITDVAGNDLSGTFTGEVYNTNISPTDISLSAGSVLENNAIGDVVAMLTASDPDAGDTHTFSFATGAGDADNASFTIDSNELKAAEVFDLETKAGYSIRIQADDGRGGTYEKVFTIAIDNVPEADMRITGDLDIPATPLGISTTFDITIHNDGDATLDVTSIFYPTAFNGPVSGNSIAPGGSEVITMSFTPPAAQTYTGDITINSNGGTGILSLSADGAIITSLERETLDAEAIRIYPNPATDMVTIDLSGYYGQGLDIQLYDVSGNETFAVSDYRKTELRLDVSTYRNGLYLVQFTNRSNTVQKKIMIRK
ncbi:MAG: T9SS type A sorting domain-containing protein [Roseivirga sp.]|nr:T9SS type A sorting domain-containing protein [Roseivirga sp.]